MTTKSINKFHRICKIKNCDSRHYARGWCNKHYMRWRKHCDPKKVLSFHGDPEAAFEARVDKNGPNGCWLWTGTKIPDGYGHLRVNGNPMLAHRFSWGLHNGPIPEGLYILHHCDNPPCVNPDHLFLGTHQDNMADMAAKGRQANLKGEAHGMSKLTASEIPLIQADNRTQKAIAADYGVCQANVSFIKNNKIWKHIKGANNVR